MENTCYYTFESFKLSLTEKDGAITRLSFVGEKEVLENENRDSPLLRGAVTQLEQYFSGRRKEFFLPLNPLGTEFMVKVWEALQSIPYGETRSYKQIAIQVGHDKAYRAVGLANNRNPISIIIPCHRVIGYDGRLVGFGGGLPLKEKLLQLEQKYYSP